MNADFSIMIKDDKFYVFGDLSTEENSALNTVNKIELIIRKNLKCVYSQVSYIEAQNPFEGLRKAAKTLTESYLASKVKASSFSFVKLTNIFFNEEAIVRKTYLKIEDYLHPKFLALPLDLIEKINSHLAFVDISSFIRINSLFYARVKSAKNRELDSYFTSLAYYKRFHDELRSLAASNLLPHRCQDRKNNFVLTCLSSLSSEEIFEIFGTPKIYSAPYRKLVDFLIVYARAPGRYKSAATRVAMLAVQHRAESVLKLLMLHGLDPNCEFYLPNEGTASFLHVLIYNDLLNSVQIALQRDADVNWKSPKGVTALAASCRKEKDVSIDLVKLLLKWGADLHIAGEDGSQALHHAAQRGLFDVVSLLIKCGADVNRADKNGYTALDWACQSEKAHIEVVKLLVNYGANLQGAAKSHNQPLHHAAQKNHVDIVEFLLESGANVDQPGESGQTALSLACQGLHENTEVVSLLLKWDADLKMAGQDGSPPLHHAAQRGYVNIMNALFVGGANVNQRGRGGHTALSVACQSKDARIEVVSLLLKWDANLYLTGDDGSQALHHAALGGHVGIVKLLLRHAAHPAQLAKGIQATLSLICQREDASFEMVKILLEYSQHSPQPVEISCQALHFAAQAGHADIVELFLKAGVKVNALGFKNSTPLHYACGFDASNRPNVNVVKLLLQYGANQYTVNEDGEFPIGYAFKNQATEICVLLQECSTAAPYKLL